MVLAASIHTLIVDDQASTRALLKNNLQQLGFVRIHELGDGEEAVKWLQGNVVQLIISDFNMPRMDGLGLLRAVRANPATQKTAFVMLTGRADRELVMDAMKEGVNNYLVKPFNVPVLKGKLEQVFGRLN